MVTLREALEALGYSKDDDVNKQDDENDGRRPLHEAARRGHESAVPVLLAAGAEVDAGDDHGTTALHLACISCRNLGIVRLLLEANADVNKPTGDAGWTPLHCAINQPDQPHLYGLYFGWESTASNCVSVAQQPFPLFVFVCVRRCLDMQHVYVIASLI